MPAVIADWQVEGLCVRSGGRVIRNLLADYGWVHKIIKYLITHLDSVEKCRVNYIPHGCSIYHP